ncbi:MAG: SMP-30/gluconolactonase/LRE family protein, partial [Bradyrhizobiaceae bacterium]|nr:SMP-30/gluconolactonase/LRE family protein [Bradyrhizobiaceae bacterium]
MEISRRDILGAGAATAAAALTSSATFGGWEPSEAYPDPAVKVLDPSFAKYRLFNASIERLYTGARWSEGPVWFGDARCVLWSDIPNNRILKWDEETGTTSVYRKPSNQANGNTRDRQGRLVTCEHDARRVTRTEYDGSVKVLIDRFEGKPLNSPNDVVVKSDGSVWFSDPPFGIRGNYEGHFARPELPTNVYRLDPQTGRATVVVGDILPNGLCFTPDEKKMYIVDATNTPRVIRVYDVDGDKLTGGKAFVTCQAAETPDGFRCDVDGN